jgi:hypothetical protein
MTNAEIREMQERAARWKMKEDLEKKRVLEPEAPEVKVGQGEPKLEKDKSIAEQIAEKRRESARKYRERNKAMLAEKERARRAK